MVGTTGCCGWCCAGRCGRHGGGQPGGHLVGHPGWAQWAEGVVACLPESLLGIRAESKPTPSLTEVPCFPGTRMRTCKTSPKQETSTATPSPRLASKSRTSATDTMAISIARPPALQSSVTPPQLPPAALTPPHRHTASSTRQRPSHQCPDHKHSRGQRHLVTNTVTTNASIANSISSANTMSPNTTTVSNTFTTSITAATSIQGQQHGRHRLHQHQTSHVLTTSALALSSPAAPMTALPPSLPASSNQPLATFGDILIFSLARRGCGRGKGLKGWVPMASTQGHLGSRPPTHPPRTLSGSVTATSISRRRVEPTVTGPTHA